MAICSNCGRHWSYDGSIQQDNRCFTCHNNNSIGKSFPTLAKDPWDKWIEKNIQNLKHPANYELQFVNDILRKIPNIDPTDVTAQYHFVDNKGTNRYIDFFIENKEKAYRLPIELDGLWKVQAYNDFNDMLARQNSLIQEFQVLLRYTNAQMKYEAATIIKQITATLNMQKSNRDITAVQEQNNKNLINDYENQIKDLKKELGDHTKNPSVTNEEIRDIRNTLDQITGILGTININNITNPTPIPTTTLPAAQSNPIEVRGFTLKQMMVAGIGFIVIVAIGASIFKMSHNSYQYEDLSQTSTSIKDINSADRTSDLNGEKSFNFNNDETLPDEKSFNFNNDETLPDDKFSKSEQYQTPQSQTRMPSTSYTLDSSEETIKQIPANIVAVNKPVEEPEIEIIEKPVNTTTSKINSNQASHYIGKYSTVCGVLSEIKPFSKGVYLNIGGNYPNQDLTAVVWDNNKPNFSNIEQMQSTNLCISGKISEYKGIPQINLTTPSQIK